MRRERLDRACIGERAGESMRDTGMGDENLTKELSLGAIGAGKPELYGAAGCARIPEQQIRKAPQPAGGQPWLKFAALPGAHNGPTPQPHPPPQFPPGP